MMSDRGSPLFSQRPVSMRRIVIPGRAGVSEAVPSGKNTQQYLSAVVFNSLAESAERATNPSICTNTHTNTHTDVTAYEISLNKEL